jgi:hypothetical protein
MHLAHGIYPGGVEGWRQFYGIKRDVISNRSQRYLPNPPGDNARCYRDIHDRLSRQQLPRRRERSDACCDIDCGAKEVVRSAEYWAVVQAGPCQRNLGFGSASWKQTSKHLKGGCRVGKPKHRFVTYPLDRLPKPSESLAHQFFETLKHCYCRSISINIGYRTEAR